MVTVRDLLRTKGNNVWSVPPSTVVLDVLKMLADKDAGALLVLDRDRIAGIISERDIVRSMGKTGQCSFEATVDQYMTKDVITVSPVTSLEECMQIMTRKHIRHLPVLENGRLAGLISIGDVVKNLISSRDSTINSLENYITGGR
jgi:CBS domain-containing protein